MGEHMQMLHETMRKCRERKPQANMTTSERDEWYVEHQKLMDQMMDSSRTPRSAVSADITQIETQFDKK